LNYLEDVASAIRGQVPAKQLPDGDLDLLFRIYAVLALAKGEAVVEADVHDAWAAWILSESPSHPNAKPFSELPGHIQAEDLPFLRAVLQTVKLLGISGRG
jgi:hypothetical protein